MTYDLVKRLRKRESQLRGLGSIAHDDANMDEEAADRIEELEKQLVAATKQIKELEDEIENLEYEMCELENRDE